MSKETSAWKESPTVRFDSVRQKFGLVMAWLWRMLMRLLVGFTVPALAGYGLYKLDATTGVQQRNLWIVFAVFALVFSCLFFRFFTWRDNAKYAASKDKLLTKLRLRSWKY